MSPTTTTPAPSPGLDPQVTNPLYRLQASLRRYIAWEGLLLVGTFLATWFWIGLALDYGPFRLFGWDWVQDAPRSMRRVALIAVLAVLATLVIRRIVIRLMKDFSARSFALVLEKKFPDILGDRLITAIELADPSKTAKYGYSAVMILQTVAEANERMARVPVDQVFDWARLRRKAVRFGLLSVGVMVVIGVIVMAVSRAGAVPAARNMKDVAIIWGERNLLLRNVPWPRNAYLELLDTAGDETRIGRDNPTFRARVRAYQWVVADRTRREGWRPAVWSDLPTLVPNVKLPPLPYAELQAVQARRSNAVAGVASGLAPMAFPQLGLPADVASLPNDPAAWKIDVVQSLVTGDPDWRAYFAGEKFDRALGEWKKIVTDDLSKSALKDKARLIAAASDPAGSRENWEAARTLFDSRADYPEFRAIVEKTTNDAGQIVDRPIFAEFRTLFAPGGYSRVASGNSRRTTFAEPMVALLGELDAKAASPTMTRKFRKLTLPTAVKLFARGEKTDIETDLKAEGYNEFSTQLAALKESVKVRAKGGDYVTPDRQLTLVPPPTLTMLKRTELRPASHYYFPPTIDGNAAGSIDGDPLGDRNLLKGVKQVFADLQVTLTGDKSAFEVAVGTDLTLSGETDKALSAALALPVAGKFAGIDTVEQETPIPLKVGADRKSFTCSFTSAGKSVKDIIAGKLTGEFLPVLRPTEFDLKLVDTDGVTSVRRIQIIPDDDTPPEVTLLVEALRKVGSTYLCTPKAFITFSRDSKITDDVGLHKVRYVYTGVEVQQTAVVAGKIESLGWLWASVPIFPTFGEAIYRTEVLRRTAIGGGRSFEGRKPLAGFRSEYENKASRFRIPAQSLAGKVAQPWEGGDRPIPRLYEFKGIPLDALTFSKIRPGDREDTAFEFSGDKSEGFDLQAMLRERGLLKNTQVEYQPSYLITLGVAATDAEVDGPSRVGVNRDPIQLRVVPDGELLSEITREQSELARKLDDVLARAESMKKGLETLFDRLPVLASQARTEQTRSEEIFDNLNKAREITGEIQSDYVRILREMAYNRLDKGEDGSKKLILDTHNKITQPLKSVLETEFREFDDTFTVVNNLIRAVQPPDGATQALARQRLEALRQKLAFIRGSMGETIDLSKTISKLEDVLQRQQGIQYAIESAVKETTENIFNVVPKPPTIIELAVGEKKSIKFPVKIPDNPISDPLLKYSIPAESGIVVPDEVVLKDDAKEATLDITAGMKPGTYLLRITPSPGKAIDVRVVVK